MDSIIKQEHGLLIWLITIVVSAIATVLYFVVKKSPAPATNRSTLDNFPMWYEMLPSEEVLTALARSSAARARAERTKQIAAMYRLYTTAILGKLRVTRIPVKLG